LATGLLAFGFWFLARVARVF